MSDRAPLKDIQSEYDDRNIPIERVGVKDIRHPVAVYDPVNGVQHTVARVNMYVSLPHNFRGTHMSRFIEILNMYPEIKPSKASEILEEMKTRLDAETSFFDIEFPYFIMKKAPVSGAAANMEYMCSIHGDSSVNYYTISVTVPVLTLCPCSREISKHGAHNQRSHVKITVNTSRIIWFEELIDIAESSASSPLYALLKREDEKFVTEKSYENPHFVEDVVRNAGVKLASLDGVISYEVESDNMESIHNHSAYAKVSGVNE